MIDIAKVTEILEHHFATVTQEEFIANLEKFCPELFEEEKNRELEQLKDTEIYQKAKEDSKLEIAPKLFQKGLSIQEVAEILDLDLGILQKLSS